MEDSIKIQIRDLGFCYQTRPILEKVSLDIQSRSITSVTGPSGQGKSTFLTVLNRLWQNISGVQVTGEVAIDFGSGFKNINHRDYDLPRLRQKVGMVFQMPNPLPMSIFRNIAFPLKLVGEKDRETIGRKVEQALKQAFLWEEVKDRLYDDALQLSGGQQQRLCIARALVLAPQVLLLDEPTSSLDESSVRQVERLLLDLKKTTTIILVSHYMDQVKRIANRQLILSNRKLKPLD